MSGWRECKLGDYVHINMGQSPKSEYYNDKGEGVPFLQGNRTFGTRFPTIDTFCTDPKKMANNGDILISVRAPVGDLNIANQEICIGRGLAALNTKFGDNIFLFYLLHSIKEEILVAEGGTVFGSINKNNLENLDIHLPPLPEQRAIAGVLSSLDDKIDLLHRQNRTLEGMAEALFRQWFVEGKEEGWDMTTLDEFSQNIRQSAKVEDLKNYDYYVGLEHIPKKCIALSNWGTPNELESNKSVFIKNDILFGKLRSYFHKVVFAPVNGVCSTDILVIRPKKNGWFSFCLFWFFNKDVVEHSDLGSGGTRMPRTNWEILSNYKIPKPDYIKIEEFDNIIRPTTEKITFNISQIRTLEKLRDTLLPKLMSGEVRVGMEVNA